jgi:hypothetical protein
VAFQIVGQTVAKPITVGRQAGDRGNEKERQEDVQERRTSQDEGQSVEGQ